MFAELLSALTLLAAAALLAFLSYTVGYISALANERIQR